MLHVLRSWLSSAEMHHAEPVANSLESSHDNIHTLVGGAGHMAEVPYAGMSPVIGRIHLCSFKRSI